MRPRIFVTQPVSRSAIERLRRVASVRVNPDSSRIIPKKALLAAVRASDIVFSLLHDRIDREVLAANPKLAAVASQSITPDNIDVAEATRRKIPVTVVPPIVAEATADLTFGLMLTVARRMVEGDRLVHRGRFPGAQSSHLLGTALYGKTIGLVGGGGRIGTGVARRARGFDMRVLYWSPRRKPDGLASAVLKGGNAGRARIVVRGEGPNLRLPALPLSLGVAVQLRRSDGTGACWGAAHDFIVRNRSDRYTAKGN